ncbi:MAG TPA: lysophospholipid acyltransferase family protein [Tepidisphaeraceae bacterium]
MSDWISPEVNGSAWRARLAQAANRAYVRGYHRLKVLTPCALPRTGPAILVCNHISGLDPALIQCTTRRLIVWMMAREYYEQRGLTWFFRAISAIPVEREKRDLTSLRRAMRVLAAGHVLGVFPEGRLETTRELLPFQTGVAMLAIKTGTAVYPSWLEGTQRKAASMLQAWLQPQEGCLAYGPAVDLSRFAGRVSDVQLSTNVIQEAVQRLRQDHCLRPLEKNRNKIPTDG